MQPLYDKIINNHHIKVANIINITFLGILCLEGIRYFLHYHYFFELM